MAGYESLTSHPGEPKTTAVFLNARGDVMTRSGFEYILEKHVRTAGAEPPATSTSPFFSTVEVCKLRACSNSAAAVHARDFGSNSSAVLSVFETDILAFGRSGARIIGLTSYGPDAAWAGALAAGACHCVGKDRFGDSLPGLIRNGVLSD
jgi:hypothetical protein